MCLSTCTPNSLPRNMIQPFQECGLDGAIYGFGVETGLHALRIITAGVFDRFPKLQMIIGHGQATAVLGYRLDYMHRATVASNPVRRQATEEKTQRLPARKLLHHQQRRGVGTAIKFTQSVIGVDRVLYAMDYPYQYTVDEVWSWTTCR